MAAMRLRDLHSVPCASRALRGLFEAQTVSIDIDPKRCPLCAGDNNCAVARGRGECWCFTRSIPDDVLARLPPEVHLRACVCATCAFGVNDPASTLQRLADIIRRRNGVP